MRAATLFLSLAVLAGCAGATRNPPVSYTPPPSIGPDSTDLEPANGLPRGAAVNAPLTPSFGNVGTTRTTPRPP